MWLQPPMYTWKGTVIAVGEAAADRSFKKNDIYKLPSVYWFQIYAHVYRHMCLIPKVLINWLKNLTC